MAVFRAARLTGSATRDRRTWITWSLRMRAMRNHGQAATGFVEDAIVVPAATA
jgi:hypothetical protein